jgi:hypothetical protein
MEKVKAAVSGNRSVPGKKLVMIRGTPMHSSISMMSLRKYTWINRLYSFSPHRNNSSQ